MNTSRNGEWYSDDEIKAIKNGKYTAEEIAKYTNRSVGSIKRKMRELTGTSRRPLR